MGKEHVEVLFIFLVKYRARSSAEREEGGRDWRRAEKV